MRRKSMHSKYLVLALAIGAANTGYAQSDDGLRQIEEILVTARKKEESLQDVPIAITAIDAGTIANTGAKGLEDIARLTPGFAFERTVGSLSQPSIRGVVQGRVTNPVQNVATFLNGVYLQRSYQVDSDLLNLERVEVIKGPQSALFGRNAFGGAISYTTKTPDLEELQGEIQVELGSDELQSWKGTVSVPLSDKIAVSLSASTSEFDGTWKNDNTASESLSGSAIRTDGNVGGYDNSGYMVQLYAEPTDWISAKLFYSHRDLFSESAATYQMSANALIRAGNTLNCNNIEGTMNPGFFCGEIPVDIVVAAGEPRPEGLLIDRRSYGQDGDSDVGGVSLAFDLSDSMTLGYDFGYTKADSTNVATLSGDPVNGTFFGFTLFDSRGNGDIQSKSHDLRFNYENDSLRVLAGVFLSESEDYAYGASFALAPNTADPLAVPIFPGYTASQRDEDIAAVYGLVSYDFTDALNVTFEGRQTREDITEQAIDFASGAAIGTKFEEEFSYFTPRLSVAYSLNDNINLYASGATGTKSGGFNPSAVLANEQVYDQEENTTYELGVKGLLFDNSLSFDAAVYMTDWSDLQGSTGQTGGVIGTPLIITNTTSAEIMGFEVSALYYATDSVTVNFGYSLSDAEYEGGAIDPRIPRALCSAGSLTCPYTGEVGGNQIPRTPKTQANVGVAYDSEVATVAGSALNLYARADVSYQSKQYTDPLNTSYVPDRTIVDASVGVYTDNWKLRVWAKNLFDEEYVTYAFATIGIFTGTGTTVAPLLGDTRTFGASLTYTF